MIAMLNNQPLRGGMTSGSSQFMDGSARSAFPRSRSSFASMGGTQQPTQGVAAAPTPPAPTPTPTMAGTPAGAPAGSPAAAPAVAPPPPPSAGSVPTTGFAASNPVSPVPLGSSSTFSPTSNSVGSVIAPSTSNRLSGIQGNVDTAIGSLSSTPDRYALAQQKFGTFADQTDPAYQNSLRSAEKFGSANGTAGSGMLRTSFGNLALQRSRDLQNERDSLFQDAQDKTMSDRTSTLASLLGAEGQVNGQDASARGEQRGERQYQADAGNTAVGQAQQQALVNDQLTNSAFNRSATQTQMGYGNDPALAQLAAAGQQGDAAQSGFQSVAQLLSLLGRSNSPSLQQILGTIQGGNAGGA